MPVTPKYTWQETEAGLQVKVELQGVSRKQLDVFATSALIKVNAPPYLLNVDLAYDVDDTRSTASVDNSCVKFNLVKKSPGLWGKLAIEGDKDAIARRREQSIDDAHAAANAARKAAVEKKKKDEKLIQERQYELENSKRRTIEKHKKAEFDAEADGLKRWQRSLHDPAANDSDTESEDEEDNAAADTVPEKRMADHPDYHGRGWRSEVNSQAMEQLSVESPTTEPTAELGQKEGITEKHVGMWDEDEAEDHSRYSTDTDSDSNADHEEYVGAHEPATAVKLLPPPRRTMQPVEVAFTKLETDVLPARENRELELKEYKKQQQESAGLLDTMDVAERQPVFLKEKGDALYAQGNFHGAINAYSTALQMDPNHLLSLSNRAACWLKLKAADRCLADCDDALELLRPRLKRWETGDASEEELTKFKRTFTRVLARKGAAHVQLEELPEALAAYEEAAKFSCEDAALQRNLEEVKASMGQMDYTALRQRADARFKAGDHIGAAEAYGMLLSLAGLAPTERTAALSNRSACWLVAGEFQAGVNDCNEGIVGLLEGQGVTGLEDLHAWVELQADQSSEAGGESAWVEDPKWKSLQRLLARRGAAYSHLRLYAAAADDLTTSARMARCTGDHCHADALAADAARIREMVGAVPATEHLEQPGMCQMD